MKKSTWGERLDLEQGKRDMAEIIKEVEFNNEIEKRKDKDNPGHLFFNEEVADLARSLGQIAKFEREYVNANSILIKQAAEQVIIQLGIPAEMVSDSDFWSEFRKGKEEA